MGPIHSNELDSHKYMLKGYFDLVKEKTAIWRENIFVVYNMHS